MKHICTTESHANIRRSCTSTYELRLPGYLVLCQLRTSDKKFGGIMLTCISRYAPHVCLGTRWPATIALRLRWVWSKFPLCQQVAPCRLDCAVGAHLCVAAVHPCDAAGVKVQGSWLDACGTM